jgi:hypothetical protein
MPASSAVVAILALCPPVPLRGAGNRAGSEGEAPMGVLSGCTDSTLASSVNAPSRCSFFPKGGHRVQARSSMCGQVPSENANSR